MLKPSLRWTVAAFALVALVALPVAASQEAGSQELTAQEEEILAKVKEEVKAAMEEMKENLARMKEEIAAMHEGGMLLREYNAQIDDFELGEEAMVRELKLAEEETKRAMEGARMAAEMHALRIPELHFVGEAPNVWSWRSAEYGSFVLDLAEKLALTDVQKDQIRDLQRENRRQTISRRADIEVAEMDLEALEDTDVPDLTAIRAQLETLGSLKIDEKIAGMQLEQQIRQVLTPEQRTQIDEIGEKFGPNRVRFVTKRR
jgi:hypothetical protein